MDLEENNKMMRKCLLSVLVELLLGDILLLHLGHHLGIDLWLVRTEEQN